MPMSKSKKKFYAVARGKTPGIYDTWFGPHGAEAQIKGFAQARYKGFPTRAEAEAWIDDIDSGKISAVYNGPKKDNSQATPKMDAEAQLKEGKTVIYTDGGAINNPGPGGYGIVFKQGKTRKEFSAGFRLTTNNRMEMMAVIEGLKLLAEPTPVVVVSDSRYVVNGIEKGWAKRWRAKNWMRTKDEPAKNPDLWGKLLDLCETHQVRFSWVKGHAGHPENERCDQLAVAAAKNPEIHSVDSVYEADPDQA